jgi:hypothetical protein
MWQYIVWSEIFPGPVNLFQTICPASGPSHRPTRLMLPSLGPTGMMPLNMATIPRGLPGAFVAQTAAYVNYQDGAVVSREIVKKSTGSITLFAFDEEQGLSEHTAPFDALVQILEGEAEIIITGNPHRLQAAR